MEISSVIVLCCVVPCVPKLYRLPLTIGDVDALAPMSVNGRSKSSIILSISLAGREAKVGLENPLGLPFRGKSRGALGWMHDWKVVAVRWRFVWQSGRLARRHTGSDRFVQL